MSLMSVRLGRKRYYVSFLPQGHDPSGEKEKNDDLN